MMVGSGLLGSAATNDADFRVPLGMLIGFGGFLIFLVPTAGLAALIGSRFAKSRMARVFLNLLGASAALVIVGAGFSVLLAYNSVQVLAQKKENATAALLVQAKQGDGDSQLKYSQDLLTKCMYENNEAYHEQLRSGNANEFTLPCSCPEALHWSRQAAFQRPEPNKAAGVVQHAYLGCAPGNVIDNKILAHVWENIEKGSPPDQGSLERFEKGLTSFWGDYTYFKLEPDTILAALDSAEKLTTRGLEIFEDLDGSAEDRQLAMDSAAQELLPHINVEISD